MEWAGPELTLEEMLADPIVRLLMRSDGVTGAEIRAVMARAAADLDAPARVWRSRVRDLAAGAPADVQP